jgi:hypothetical protein
MQYNFPAVQYRRYCCCLQARPQSTQHNGGGSCVGATHNINSTISPAKRTTATSLSQLPRQCDTPSKRKAFNEPQIERMTLITLIERETQKSSPVPIGALGQLVNSRITLPVLAHPPFLPPSRLHLLDNAALALYLKPG